MNIEAIGYIKTDFPEKFGIPRQSGILGELESKIYFYPAYRNPDAFKGLSDFSHIWLLWNFDIPQKAGYSATVKPPRLGGNTPMGVFATRSPFRPNPIGLSSVTLKSIDYTAEGPVLTVTGADLRDETLIYDIKPYLKYTDSHPEAKDGFAAEQMDKQLRVNITDKQLSIFPKEKRKAVISILEQDPRPHYQNSADRIYGVAFSDMDIHFYVEGDTLTVTDVSPYHKKNKK